MKIETLCPGCSESPFEIGGLVTLRLPGCAACGAIERLICRNCLVIYKRGEPGQVAAQLSRIELAVAEKEGNA